MERLRSGLFARVGNWTYTCYAFACVTPDLPPFFVRTVCLLLMVASGAFAAPVNDVFANRLPIFNGSSNAQTGSNVGATLEGTEPIPVGYTSASYSGTVWYEFQPAADGWYEVNTVGSSFDTVLAIWTGPNLSSLALEQVNDEAATGQVSRIRFQSHGAPDTSYYIAVAGRSPTARGNYKVTVQLGGNQMITALSAASFSPSTVDVTSAAATTTFSVVMSTSANVASGYVKLYDPNYTLAATATYSVTNRVGGSNINATYNVTVTMPRFLSPGTYVMGFQAQNATTNPTEVDSFGWEQMTAFLGAPTLTVQNTGGSDTYSQFVAANGLTGANAARTADPDGDGIENLTEFAFGLDPNVGSVAHLVTSGGTLSSRGLPNTYPTGTGSLQRLRVEFIRRVGDPAVTYQVEFSDDLVHWTAATNAAVVLGTSGGYEAVSVDDVTTGAVRPRRFAHVVINYSIP